MCVELPRNAVCISFSIAILLWFILPIMWHCVYSLLVNSKTLPFKIWCCFGLWKRQPRHFLYDFMILVFGGGDGGGHEAHGFFMVYCVRNSEDAKHNSYAGHTHDIYLPAKQNFQNFHHSSFPFQFMFIQTLSDHRPTSLQICVCECFFINFSHWSAKISNSINEVVFAYKIAYFHCSCPSIRLANANANHFWLFVESA